VGDASKRCGKEKKKEGTQGGFKSLSMGRRRTIEKVLNGGHGDWNFQAKTNQFSSAPIEYSQGKETENLTARRYVAIKGWYQYGYAGKRRGFLDLLAGRVLWRGPAGGCV